MQLKNATTDVLQANNTARKLKLKLPKLTLKSTGNILASEITAYCNASFANIKDGKSQGGYIAFIKSRDMFSVVKEVKEDKKSC